MTDHLDSLAEFGRASKRTLRAVIEHAGGKLWEDDDARVNFHVLIPDAEVSFAGVQEKIRRSATSLGWAVVRSSEVGGLWIENKKGERWHITITGARAGGERDHVRLSLVNGMAARVAS